MVYNLYIDVVFFVNLVMDVIVLITVKTLLRVRTSAARILAAAVLGSCFACILAVWPVLPAWLELVLTYVGIGSLMVKVALHTKGIRELIRGVLGLYLASVTLAGTMYALYQHTRFGYYVEQLIRGRLMEGLPLIIWMLLVAGACLGNRYLFINLLEIRKQKSSIYEVKLICGDGVIVTTGLLDTGNHLYEPMSHRPVHVVTETVWSRLPREEEALFLIPFHTIGTEEGVMPARFIDAMEVKGEQGQRTITKPLIAVSPHVLSREGRYEILLHEDN